MSSRTKELRSWGDAWAQCILGVAYFEGVGTRRDPIEAVRWTRKAARQGDDTAQYNLGLAYLDADGAQKPETRAQLVE